jgi:hypothetical protein
MNNIIEKHFIIGADKMHTQLIKESFGNNWSERNIGKTGHLIYIDTISKQTLWSSVIEKPSSPVSRFSDYLKEIDSTDFNKIMLFVSTYPKYSEVSVPFTGHRNKEYPLIDAVLHETNGWIVYHYQLEALFLMFSGYDREEAIAFRKRINKKDTHAFYEASRIAIYDCDFHYLIKKRMVLQFTVSSRYHAACILYIHLN